MSDYAYGDTETSYERLRVLARMFHDSSAALLTRLAQDSPGVALDLGCGPGDTTRLVRDTFPGAAVFGLDASSGVVAAARSLGPPDIRFETADVTAKRLLGAPADLIYARFLVLHLPDTGQLVGNWSRQLRPRGCLVLEDTEDVVTDAPLFKAYFEIATVPLQWRGEDRFAGRSMSRVRPVEGTVVERNATATVQPSVGDVARMFSLNLPALRAHTAVRTRFGDEELAGLANQLARLIDDNTVGTITWTIRQLVIRRIDDTPERDH
jgi:SAM-dependent methyltransferase